jgi:hypothetical protein
MAVNIVGKITNTILKISNGISNGNGISWNNSTIIKTPLD